MAALLCFDTGIISNFSQSGNTRHSGDKKKMLRIEASPLAAATFL
jgi:hypothetical protein